MNEAMVEAELDKSWITVFRRLGCNLGKVKKKIGKVDDSRRKTKSCNV